MIMPFELEGRRLEKLDHWLRAEGELKTFDVGTNLVGSSRQWWPSSRDFPAGLAALERPCGDEAR
jgi:hypothetical protein